MTAPRGAVTSRAGGARGAGRRQASRPRGEAPAAVLRDASPRHRARRGLTRWEVLLGLVLVALTAAYARPRYLLFRHRTLRAEVGLVLESLRAAEQAHLRATGAYFELPWSPRGPEGIGADPVPWAGVPGWTPPMPAVRGAYHLERGADGVRFVGVCDVDGDGEPARYVATPETAPRRVTPEHVY